MIGGDQAKLCHFELLVEEPSMEAFLQEVLSRTVTSCTFNIHTFQGRPDLIKKIQGRLHGYAKWITSGYRIVILVDRDSDDCHDLKRRLEDMAASAGLVSRSRSAGRNWQVVNRIVVEELEAWYFGDWNAVRSAYPRVPANIPSQRDYRDPDSITGGTWETFGRILRRRGYFQTGLRKVEAARAIGAHINPSRNRSRSFLTFYNAIVEGTSS